MTVQRTGNSSSSGSKCISTWGVKINLCDAAGSKSTGMLTESCSVLSVDSCRQQRESSLKWFTQNRQCVPTAVCLWVLVCFLLCLCFFFFGPENVTLTATSYSCYDALSASNRTRVHRAGYHCWTQRCDVAASSRGLRTPYTPAPPELGTWTWLIWDWIYLRMDFPKTCSQFWGFKIPEQWKMN